MRFVEVRVLNDSGSTRMYYQWDFSFKVFRHYNLGPYQSVLGSTSMGKVKRYVGKCSPVFLWVMEMNRNGWIVIRVILVKLRVRIQSGLTKSTRYQNPTPRNSQPPPSRGDGRPPTLVSSDIFLTLDSSGPLRPDFQVRTVLVTGPFRGSRIPRHVSPVNKNWLKWGS